MDFPNNSSIEAEEIWIGKDFQIGSNVRIKVRGVFSIGNFGRFGNNVTINAEKVLIGDHFYHYTDGLNIGGGGSQFPEAELVVGHRCVFHNNYINLASKVVIGNDVGLSPDVQILTHGFWNSILEGYPFAYKGVKIANGVIIGQRSMILPGVEIRENVVVGAQSTVTNSLFEENSIYAGNPARLIRKIVEPSLETKIDMLDLLMLRYKELTQTRVYVTYPFITTETIAINVETKEITGTETEATDKLRHFLSRYGIRIYTERPFKSIC